MDLPADGSQLPARAAQLIEEFAKFNDWEDRYRHLIQKGKALPEIAEKFQIEKFKVNGCQSQVWLVPSLDDGRVQFLASSDAMIVKGIISLLVEVYSDATPAEILEFEPDYLKKIGITDHLSMNRTNGLASMIKQIKMYGVAYQAMVAQGVKNADHP